MSNDKLDLGEDENRISSSHTNIQGPRTQSTVTRIYRKVGKILGLTLFLGSVASVPPLTYSDKNGLQARVFTEPYEDIVDRYIQQHPEWKKIEGVVYSPSSYFGKNDNMPYESVPLVKYNKSGKIVDAIWPQHDGTSISLREILKKNNSFSEKSEYFDHANAPEEEAIRIHEGLLSTLLHTAKSENVLSNGGVRLGRLVPDALIEPFKPTSRATFRTKTNTLDDYDANTRDMILRKVASFQLPRASRDNVIAWGVGDHITGNDFLPLYTICGYDSPDEFIQAFQSGDVTANFEVGVALGIVIHAYIAEYMRVGNEQINRAQEVIEQAIIDPKEEQLKTIVADYSRQLQSARYQRSQAEGLAHQYRSELTARKREVAVLQSEINMLRRTSGKSKKILSQIKGKTDAISRTNSLIKQLEQKVKMGVGVYQNAQMVVDHLVGQQNSVIRDLKHEQSDSYIVKSNNYNRASELLNNSDNFDRVAAIYPTNVVRTLRHLPQQSALNMALINEHISGKILDVDILIPDGDMGPTTKKLSSILGVDVLFSDKVYSDEYEKNTHAQHEDIFQVWAKNILGMRSFVQDTLLRGKTENTHLYQKALFESMTMNADSYYVSYRTLRNFYKYHRDRKENGSEIFELIKREFNDLINGNPVAFRQRLEKISNPIALKQVLSQSEIDGLYEQLIPNLVTTQALTLSGNVGATPYMYTQGVSSPFSVNDKGDIILETPKNTINTLGRAMPSRIKVGNK
ncbi:MAG: hypothetical protein U0518_05470 [Candidatus Gracilibacteria bacterium]